MTYQVIPPEKALAVAALCKELQQTLSELGTYMVAQVVSAAGNRYWLISGPPGGRLLGGFNTLQSVVSAARHSGGRTRIVENLHFDRHALPWGC